MHTARWPQADQALEAFRHALERHLLIEETIVFPAFENLMRGTLTLTSAMRSDRLRIRGVLQRLVASLHARDTEAFLARCDTLDVVLYHHGEKEEGVLSPMIELALARSATDIVGAMRAFGASP